MLRACGAEVVAFPLLGTTQHHLPPPDDLYRVAAGHLAPEVLMWSASSIINILSDLNPSMIVCLTARAYHPRLHVVAPVVLDYVDSLAGSYRQRALLTTSVKAVAYRTLAFLHQRVESRFPADILRRTAAGYTDARLLRADWLPNVAWDFRRVRPEAADHDFLFVGNLGYLPNIAALNFLASIWPRIKRVRPQTTLLVAGRKPPRQVLDLVAQQGWSVAFDFVDGFDVLSRARLALAPVEHLSGISTKVLDAAAAGLPQVVSPAALRGVASGFPAVVADGQENFAAAALALLDDEPQRERLATAGRELMMSSYSVRSWTPWTEELLEMLA